MSFSFAPEGLYVIAEAGVNHNGDIGLAKRLIDVAADAGADAVKFQMFDTDEIAAEGAPLAAYQERSGESSQKAMLRRLELPRDDFRLLKDHAEAKGIEFMTTPFDAESAETLAAMGVRIIKIPSGELTNIPFLERVATLRIPVIISTGMATLEEVRDAVAPFSSLSVPFALLHCVSSYPAPADQINLRAMETLRSAFGVPVGYSDHTEGIEVPLMAVKCGALIIEKHFTLDRSMTGPDHAASLEPAELKEMIRRMRDRAVIASVKIPTQFLGDGVKRCQPCEENVRLVGRRSVTLARDLPAGTRLQTDMLAIRRPGTGIAPKELASVVGRTLTEDLPAGTVLVWNMLR